jgi:hypothetical protein
MDLFLSVKAFSIGFIWAGGYYFLLAYALHFFPLPLLYTVRDLWLVWLGALRRLGPSMRVGLGLFVCGLLV